MKRQALFFSKDKSKKKKKCHLLQFCLVPKCLITSQKAVDKIGLHVIITSAFFLGKVILRWGMLLKD